jgi:hypothetical protein
VASLAAIALFGALLRWVPGGELSLGVDDGASLLAASRPLGSIWSGILASHEVHPPLYFFYLHPWISGLSFGAFQGGGLEPWFHASNLPWAVLVVVLTGLLGDALGGRRVGLAAALLVALSNYLGYYALELRMYPMVTALLLGASLAAVRGARVAVTGCCLLAFFTHYEAVFWIAALGLFCATDGEARRWIAPALVIGVVMAGWAPVLREQAGAQPFLLRDAPSWPQAVESLFQMGCGTTWPLPLPGWRAVDGALPAIKWLGLGVLALLLGGLARADLRSRRLLALVVFLPFAALLLISALTPLRIFEYKYLQPAAPFACIAIAMGLRPTGRARVWGGVAVAALSIVNLAAWGAFVGHPDWYGPQDWRDVTARVAAALEPGDVVVVHPSMMAEPVIVYAFLARPQFFGPGGASRIVPVDEPDAPQLVSALSRAGRAWLLTPLNHPYVARMRLLDRLPAPWAAHLMGEQDSFWPANRIQTFLLTRRPVAPPRPASGPETPSAQPDAKRAQQRR